MPEPDLDETVRRAAEGSLDDVEAAFASVQRSAAAGAARAELVLRLADALTGRDLGDPERQIDLRERYLLALLEDPDGLPPEVESGVLDRLGDPAARGSETGERWAARRRRLGRAWLRALDRHASVLADGGDEPAVPQLNVRPPAATGLPPGAVPEAIEDPELRAAYEADIERNRRVAEDQRSAHAGRRLAQAMVAKAEQRAIAAYAADPPALQELREDLELVADEDARRRILDAIA